MRLRVRKLARAEIHAVFDWYRVRSPRAAADFLEAVDAAIKAIERDERARDGGRFAAAVFVRSQLNP